MSICESLKSRFRWTVFFQQVHCFHHANSRFDLLLRVTLKASLGEKKVPANVECGLGKKPVNSMLPNSGLFEILIIVGF